MRDPVVEEVVEVCDPAALGGRRDVVVRWSDGSTGVAVSYFADEVLLAESDMVGRTQAEIRSVLHRRDVEHLKLRTDVEADGVRPFFDS